MSATILDVLEGRSRWAVHRGDSLSVLQSLPDSSIDALVTDPPYSSGGAFRGDRMQSTTAKYAVKAEEAPERPDFLGDNRDQRSQLAWLGLWLSEVRRVLRDGAPFCVFTDWRMLPTTTDAVQVGGLVWRGILAWDKTEAVRPHFGRFRAQAEYVVWGSKGGMPERREVGCLPGVVRFPTAGQDKLHIAGKPPEMMEAVCRICPPGGIILDPFAGSASTGLAALRLGYRFVGIELDAHWHSVAVGRLEGTLERTNQPTQGGLFEVAR